MSTPREQGFVMPPEWAPHERCWMAWPCRAEHWGDRLGAARQAYADVAKAIAVFEPVTMVARPELTAEASLQCGQGVSVLPLEYDDAWIRDTAPTFVRNGEGLLAGIDWHFNGYGQRSPEYAHDAALAERICRRLKVPRFEAPIVFEGGALQVDGEGTGLVCAASVLDPQRNPGRSQAEIEAVLRDHLGLETVIWLAQGLVDDATGGHVDNLACFAAPGVVLALSGRRRRRRQSTDSRGQPVASARRPRRQGARARGDRGPAAGRAPPRGWQPPHRLLHQFLPRQRRGHRADLRRSHGRCRLSCDPGGLPGAPDRRDRRVGDLIHGGGGIHCITQQQPKSGTD